MYKYTLFIILFFLVCIAKGQYYGGGQHSAGAISFESANAIPLVYKMPFNHSSMLNERRVGAYEKGLIRIDSLEKNYAISYKLKQEKIYLLLRQNHLITDPAFVIYQTIKDSLTVKEKAYLETTLQYYKNIYGRMFYESTAQLTNALKLFPNDSILLYNRGISYIRQNRFDLAEKDFLKAIEFNPNDVQTLYALTFCYKWLGKPKKGMESIRKAEPLLEQQLFEDKINNSALYRLKLYFESQLGINEHSPGDVAKASAYKVINDYCPNPYLP